MDPRRPIHRPAEDQANAARDIVHAHLLECTEHGAKALGCSGASFVMMGVGIWASELHELDPKATSQLLASLSVIFDPSANDAKKKRAEQKRRSAVTKLHNAVDIDMAQPSGTA